VQLELDDVVDDAASQRGSRREAGNIEPVENDSGATLLRIGKLMGSRRCDVHPVKGT
jgi:hypothetical protein